MVCTLSSFGSAFALGALIGFFLGAYVTYRLARWAATRS